MENENFLKSYPYWTINPGAIPDALMRGFNVIVIADVEEAKNFPGCVSMSSLLPTPKMSMMLMSTDRGDPNYQDIMNQYLNEYQMHLGSPGIESVIATFIANLYKTSHPLLIYTDLDLNRQFYILDNVMIFFRNVFGIIIGRYEQLYTNNKDKMPGFIPNPEYIANILNLLFINGYISKKEFAIKIPPLTTIPLSPRACSIILSDLDYVFPTFESTLIAAYNIVNQIKEEFYTGKKYPVLQLKKTLDQNLMNEINNIVTNSKTIFGNYDKPKITN